MQLKYGITTLVPKHDVDIKTGKIFHKSDRFDEEMFMEKLVSNILKLNDRKIVKAVI